ncbi:MAG: T9SS type A sorting domain-containing protein [Bacteroidetes bacterium]|nr:T9SS type A sorting domain-containing protein [Bacteroidota bacterium]
MKKLFLSFVIIFFFITAVSFSQGTWTQKADFGGGNRLGAVGFSIGTKGYIGIGTDTGYILKNDFWEYDPSIDVWSQKANFTGSLRSDAAGFSIGTKGYVGTGAILSGSTNTFYEWDQATNTWSQKSNLNGGPRCCTVGFSIGTKGYIGTGQNNQPPIITYNDFWEWDPSTNIWTQKANFGGSTRWYAAGFSIGTKGYVGVGWNGSCPVDFWEWDQATNIWTQKASFGGGQSTGAVGFSIGTKGYLGIGCDCSGNCINNFWEWDQTTNIWTQKTNFSGAVRNGAVGFSIGTKGYVGTGGSSSTTYYKDFWEFDPNGVGVHENELNNSISVFPNPSNGKMQVALAAGSGSLTTIDIYNVHGEKVTQSNIPSGASLPAGQAGNLTIDISNQPKGIYFVKVQSESKIYTEKVVIQ